MTKTTKDQTKPTPCTRCNIPCHSDLCPNCITTQFIMSLPMAEPINQDPIKLQVPQLQKQFITLMEASNVDITFSQINWLSVIENWDLPFPEKKEEQEEQEQDNGKNKE